MKATEEQLEEIREWLLSNSGDPQIYIHDVGLPDDYVLSMVEREKCYTEIEECTLCGQIVEQGNLYLNDDGDNLCDMCEYQKNE